MSPSHRVLVVGFDGATWDLLSRYAEDGTMPELGRLRRESRWGRLRSTIPPVTAPAWAALSTGKNPGKTGIFAFYTPTDSIDHFRPITSMDVHAATLPELLEAEGLRVSVVNLPTFSYPKKTKGPVLGDILCPPDVVVQPKSLLENAVFRRYRSFPNMSLKHDLARYVQDVRDLEQARFSCAKELFGEPWDFMFVMFSGVDWIQHELYGDLLGGTKSRATDAARSFFKDLDGYVGWFVSRLGPEDHFFLVSDHGFKTTPGAFSVNGWLRNYGYIRSKSAKGGRPGLGLRNAPTVPWPLLAAVSRHRRLWRLGLGVWRAAMGRSGFAGEERPDPHRSVAFSQDYTWGIRLNSARHFSKGILDSEQEARVLAELRGRLDGLQQKGLIARHASGADVYSGPYAHSAPDIVLFPGSRSISGTPSGMVDTVSRNGHAMDGVYLMRTAGASPGEGGTASICDITPTVLTLFGLGVDADSDGTSLVAGGTKRQNAEKSEGGSATLSGDDERLIEERLRSLGYV